LWEDNKTLVKKVIFQYGRIQSEYSWLRISITNNKAFANMPDH
jgi:hypothetical protein